jgi:hypothetical protein
MTIIKNVNIDNIFSKQQLKTALTLKCTEFASCWFENNGNGEFKKTLFTNGNSIFSNIFNIHIKC